MKIFLTALYVAGVFAVPHEGRDLVEIITNSSKDFMSFQIPGFDRSDFETISPERTVVWITTEQRELMTKAGLSLSPAEDVSLKNAMAAKLQNYTYRRSNADWDQYCNYDCMTMRLKDITLACDYGLESIGETQDGRDIWVMTVGTGSPTVLMAANIHGDETTGGQLLQRWLWETCFEPSKEQDHIASTYTIAYMTMFNPDGYMRNRRGNANNQDLNRNFPAPGQSDSPSGKQKETVAFMAYVTSHRDSLKASLMYHGGSVVANYPYDNCYTSAIVPRPCPPAVSPNNAFAVSMATSYTWPSGYKCLTSNCIINGASWYQISGSSQDYNYHFKGIMDITLEVSNTKWPSRSQLPQFYTDNKAAIYSYILAAHDPKKMSS